MTGCSLHSGYLLSNPGQLDCINCLDDCKSNRPGTNINMGIFVFPKLIQSVGDLLSAREIPPVCGDRSPRLGGPTGPFTYWYVLKGELQSSYMWMQVVFFTERRRSFR